MKLDKFVKFIKESGDEDRLRELGLAPDLEWDERYKRLVDEWGSDPQVEKAFSLLISRSKEIFNKWKTDEDEENESEFQQWCEWTAGENRISETGLLEFLILAEYI